jgi:hydroxymethylglutaryl-CoA reductase
MARTSRFPGFYNITVRERRALVSEATGVHPEEIERTLEAGGLDAETADKFVENVLGTYALPYGVALNVRVNDHDHVVPMVIEEPSVVAAASSAAKMVRESGGFVAEMDPPRMIAQVEVRALRDAQGSAKCVREHAEEIMKRADAAVPGLIARGGGACEIEARVLAEDVIAVHVVIDCRDAMGANLVNTVAEAVADRIAAIAGGRVGLRILSNLCDKRCVRVRCTVRSDILATETMNGDDVIDGIVGASRFAELDPYRAATHAFATRTGRYQPLAVWHRKGADLEGRLELPLALGTVGGTLRVHPAARLSLQLLGVSDAQGLASIAASIGLASNLAAVRALATDGIQRGHMGLHARAVALAAGAVADQVERVAAIIVEARDITLEGARRALVVLTGGSEDGLGAAQMAD